MNGSIKQLLRSFAAAMAIGVGLMSCTHDEGPTPAGEPLPPGKYPLILNAAGFQAVPTPDGASAPATRGTVDGDWQGANENVAIRIGEETKEYTLQASDGENWTKATLKSEAGFYWNTTGDSKDITAWYPYNGGKSLWKVNPDQSEDANYLASDFLSGQIYGLTFAEQGDVPLVFYHQTAKVIIRIKEGEPITSENGVTSVTIGDTSLALESTYTAPVSNSEHYGEWSTTNADTKGPITPHPQSATEDGFVASYEALLIPQTVGDGTTLFTITLQNNLTFYYKPGSPIQWHSGKQYIYNIKLQGGTLNVTVAGENISWNESGASGSGSVEIE